MSEEKCTRIERMMEAISRLPANEAEKVVYEAAVRAETLADYLEWIVQSRPA